jgi:hypothetical protein
MIPLPGIRVVFGWFAFPGLLLPFGVKSTQLITQKKIC